MFDAGKQYNGFYERSPTYIPDVFGRLVLQMPRHDSKCLLPFSTMQCRIILNLESKYFLGYLLCLPSGRQRNEQNSIELQKFLNLILIRIMYVFIFEFLDFWTKFKNLKQNEEIKRKINWEKHCVKFCRLVEKYFFIIKIQGQTVIF